MTGIGYRPELAEWIGSRPNGVECLEITAEHFYARSVERLKELRQDYNLFVHGLGLSLGTPGSLDMQRLNQFARVVRAADPHWISEHVAFTRSGEVDLGHLNPLRPTSEAARIVAEHARQIADHCEKPLLLENITTHLRVEGEMKETEFLNEICSRANCGLLLDVTNLFINSRNHGFDPVSWLRELNCSNIRQLHVVGYSCRGERFVDNHAEEVQPELLQLAQAVIDHAPVKAIILERDVNFPGADVMQREITKLRRLFERN